MPLLVVELGAPLRSWRVKQARKPSTPRRPWQKPEQENDARTTRECGRLIARPAPELFSANTFAASWLLQGSGNEPRPIATSGRTLNSRAAQSKLIPSVSTCEQLWAHRRDRLGRRSMPMSASHHPTDVHLRQHRAKKRDKLRARIAAAPATGRAALEAKVQRTYSPFHTRMTEKAPPAVV